MSKRPETKPTEMTIDELRKKRPGWRHVVQPLDNGHVRIISTKHPPNAK